MNSRLFVLILLLLLTGLGWSTNAQTVPLAAGVVLSASRATVQNTNLTEGATIFSGDLLRTQDGGQLQVRAGKLQLVLAESSSMRVFKQQSRILVEVETGKVTYSTTADSQDLILYGQDLKVVPPTGQAAVGQINIVSRCHITVSAIKNTLEVTSGKETKTIAESKSYSVTSEIGVDYKDSWVPVLTDYPEYPNDAPYHKSHSHGACAPAYLENTRKPPLLGVGQGHFREIVIGIVLVTTIPPIIKAHESPDRP